jgi:cytidine deaminase
MTPAHDPGGVWTVEIDWVALRAAAVDAMHGAYAPYSKFPVGVAGLVADGRVVRGCNVENASYGLTLCAECGLVSALHASGGGRLIAVSCVDADGAALMPCGRCRQLLWEHGGPMCLVDSTTGPIPMSELLPHAFDQRDLDRSVEETVEPAPHLRDMLGRGTVFVHPDMVGGVRVWTAYWDGSTGAAHRHSAILDEAPTRAAASDMIAWGLARTRRVIVVDADGEMYWAGEGPAPSEVSTVWLS